MVTEVKLEESEILTLGYVKKRNVSWTRHHKTMLLCLHDSVGRSCFSERSLYLSGRVESSGPP